MTLVVKLGSSIVAADDGELRADVLDAVCEQVAALEQGGERVVMVTSGAIARGMRLMELPVRPRAMDELQAASAVGQGDLFRAYEQRLAAAGTRAAQVLLTAADIAARTNYLNARQTLRRLIEWGVVPVVNENDTTATDEITFGDNDFLAAQVAILLEARLLVLLTDVDGLFSADPGADPGAALIADGRATSPSSTAWRSATAPRPSAPAGCAARSPPPRWRARPGSRRRSATGPSTARSPAAAAGEAVGTRFAARAGKASELQALAQVREAGPRPPARRRGRRPGPARERLEPAAGRDRRRRGRLRGRRRGRGRGRRHASSARGSSTTPPRELAR